MNRVIHVALIAVFGISSLTWGQVGIIATEWRQGDPINNRACILLADGKIAMNETRHLSAEELAKRCSTGLRVTSKGSFEEPTSIVFLIGLKSNTRLEGIQLTGWREYWFTDTSALTINRVTKVLKLVDGERIAKVISETPLWNLKNQEEIKGFDFHLLHGYSVEIELFSDGKSKRLQYSNPDSYEQLENLQFRAGLHKLLSDLELSSGEFVFDLHELEGIELPSPHKDQAEQAGAGQRATSPQSKPEGGEKPQPEAEGRSR